MKNIDFKGIEVGIKITDIDFKNFMKKAGEKNNIKYDITEDGSIDLTILNMNMNITRLFRYHYKNSKNETIYVIQESEASGDDVTFVFYLTNKKIEDKDVKDLLNIYTHLDSQDNQKSIDKVNQFLG